MIDSENIELTSSIESPLKPTSIESIAKEHNVIFIHSIRPDILYGQNNAAFAKKTWDEKLSYLLENKPEIATSTIKIGDTSENMWGPMGVIINSGEIVAAHPKDAGSIVSPEGKRDTVTHKTQLQVLQEVDSAIIMRPQHRYNEIIVNNPKIAGLYMAMDQLARDSVNHKNYAGLSSRITDSEMYGASQRYNLPLFLISNGEVFRAGFDENTNELIQLDKVSHPI